MAEPFMSLALAGVDPLLNNYDKILSPIQTRSQKMFQRRKAHGKKDGHDDHEPTPEERGWVLKKRSEVQSDEEIMDTVPRNRQMIPYRPAPHRRASSLDGNHYDDRRDGRNDRRVGAWRGRHDDSDSEASLPPRSRVSNTRSKRSSSKSTSDSEDLGSTTEDERRCREANRKKWLASGLAAVATVHAAAGVYNKLEASDKRHRQVLAGELAPEEAKKKRNRGRWQDAASIGVAALGIRSALNEWYEVEEKQEEHKKYLQEREERHRRRMEKQKRAKERYLAEYRSDRENSLDADDRARGQKALKNYPEHDKHRSHSMSTHEDDRDRRALVRSKSRRRSDE